MKGWLAAWCDYPMASLVSPVQAMSSFRILQLFGKASKEAEAVRNRLRLRLGAISANTLVAWLVWVRAPCSDAGVWSQLA